MSKVTYDESLDEMWENGALGRSEEHVAVVELDIHMEESFDKAAAMTMISIRLQDSLISDLKEIAACHGLGYQPMIRQLLSRFVTAERKIMAARQEAMQITVSTQTCEPARKKTKAA